MTVAQEALQASIRAQTGTAHSLPEDWMALFDLEGIAAGHINERQLVWINGRLGTTHKALADARHAFALAQGKSHWSELTEIPALVLDDPTLRLSYDYVAGIYRQWNGSAMATVAAPSLPGETTGLGAIFPAGQAITWVIDAVAPTPSGVKYAFSLDANGSGEQVRLYQAGTGNLVFHTRTGNANTGVCSGPGPSTGANFIAAGVSATDDFALYANGASIATDNAGALPASALTDLNVGWSHNGGALFGETIRSIRFYLARKENSWLAAETTA